MAVGFLKAKPIWIEKKEQEINCRIQFKAMCDKYDNAQIHIATSGIYQLWINGKFISYGPARAGKNYFRMENINISKYLTKEKNAIVIEAAGYYCTNFYIMQQSSFLQAEVVSDDNVIIATGEDFSARMNPYYIQKIQRYSYQRTFAESYNVFNAKDSFLIDDTIGNAIICETESKKIIERKVPYPDYEKVNAQAILSGSVEEIVPKEYSYDRYVLNVGMGEGQNTGWEIDDLDFLPEKKYQELRFSLDGEKTQSIVEKNRYNIYEFSHNATGMLAVDIVCEEETALCISFDELLIDKRIDPCRSRVSNIIFYNLSAGKHHIQTFEVYTMKYLQIAVLGHKCVINNIHLIEYKHPYIEVPKYSDKDIQKIVNAAVETYRQNAVDLFTDCPSRERAGWLCDSYFLARTEYALTGKNVIEESFLENFLHEDTYGEIPYGMIPMCYPADHIDGVYIPNWAMWLVVELRDYFERTGKRKIIECFKEKIYNLLKFFKGFENSDGLLENLEGWVFVEWSRANDTDMVDGVNYPSNMMYYLMLKCASELYEDKYLAEKAKYVKSKILQQAFNGEFFVDRAKRTDNGIFPISESTEVCQYYAFFTGIADPKTHKELFERLLKEFGPNRDLKRCYPNVTPAAPFIGNYLRLQILMNYGYKAEVLENIKDYFLYMAEKTGTLWEYADNTASCNHGFASCVLYWLKECEY